MTTKLEQAARQALEALERWRDWDDCNNTAAWGLDDEDAITALREALAEQAVCKECGTKQAQIDRLMLEYCPDEMTTEQMQEWGNNQRPAEQAEQKPVAWMYEYGTDRGDAVNEIRWYPNLSFIKPSCLTRNVRPLYAAPVRTKDLTDDEMEELCRKYARFELIREAIAADREKNNANNNT